MYISKIHIQNYRNFGDFTMEFHIVFAMVFTITHHCANSIKADYCSI